MICSKRWVANWPAKAEQLRKSLQMIKVQANSSVTEDASAPRQTSWFLYLIECLDGSIYTGIAIDVAARYAEHASGKGARYTRAHPPARLLASIEYPDHSNAAKAEYRIKQLKASAKRKFLAGLIPRTPESIASAAAEESPEW